ncbi:MAG: sigma factor-like helix-turn-helix DNA-binding protein [Eubacteriales bacterium]
MDEKAARRGEIAGLFDIYSPLLSERQQQATEMYYIDDLSLSEISENLSITRQGARSLVARGVELLMFFEDSLGFSRKENEARSAAQKIKECGVSGTALAEAEKILKLFG